MTFGYSIQPNALRVPLTAHTREMLAGLVRMGLVSSDTGYTHGPDPLYECSCTNWYVCWCGYES